MRSELNADVPLANPGEFHPLRLGALSVWPPVVLAPMAGVTNAPFRTLCRRFSADRCLYVSEMITARSFADGHAKTRKLASFAQGERPRSIQLYGTDPHSLGEAARILRHEWQVDHIDINFGCPAPKVTRNGGGAAIPVRPNWMARLLRAVVQACGDAVPVTAKFRIGIDDGVLTFLDAGRVAEQEGCRAVALHARTAAQLYAGEARWHAIGELKQHVRSIPVLGNGDVFEAFDALRMMRATGCDGVVVGRGCLGRPWLFRDLCDVFDGREPQLPPSLGEIAAIAREHAQLLVAFFGERAGMLEMRKFLGWYTKSFPGVKKHMPALQLVESLAQLDAGLAGLPIEQPFPEAALRVRRCKDGGRQAVRLPHGLLADRDTDRSPLEQRLAVDLAAAEGGGDGG